MREILFRGQTASGEWVEGSLLYDSEQNESYIAKHFEDKAAYLRDVLPETVGQYTGLTDKNGKKIFEGDIVQYYGTYALEVYIEGGHTKIRWYDTISTSEYDELFFSIDREGYGECEVIGNIHDNPELLKGE